MKVKTNANSAPLFWVLAILFLSACGQSPEAREAATQEAIFRGIQQAENLIASGNLDGALQQLENLEREYPNRLEITEALAFAYVRKPDHSLAAFYFDTVYRLDPDRSEMALYSARSHAESQDWNASATAYRAYLQNNPRDANAWRALALTESSANRHKAALDAWLEFVRHNTQVLSPEDALQIGRLYLVVDNLPQAQRWLNSVVDAQASDRVRAQALLGLLQIDLQEKRWPDAEKRIAALDKAGPGVLDASPLASARTELARWRAAQDELERERKAAQAALARIEEERKQAEEAARLTSEAEASHQREATITVDRTGETISPNKENTSPTPDEQNVPPAQLADNTPTPPAQPTTAELAQAAFDSGNYTEAIIHYQNALAQSPTQADLHYGLSRAYYAQQSWSQAELHAAEAMRLSPDSLPYTLNYLRSIQRTQPRERLMDEMIRAKQRFPDSPDITLALARGYERIMNNRRNAIFLYEEFLNLAPGHPQAEEIRNHLPTLR